MACTKRSTDCRNKREKAPQAVRTERGPAAGRERLASQPDESFLRAIRFAHMLFESTVRAAGVHKKDCISAVLFVQVLKARRDHLSAAVVEGASVEGASVEGASVEGASVVGAAVVVFAT